MSRVVPALEFSLHPQGPIVLQTVYYRCFVARQIVMAMFISAVLPVAYEKKPFPLKSGVILSRS